MRTASAPHARAAARTARPQIASRSYRRQARRAACAPGKPRRSPRSLRPSRRRSPAAAFSSTCAGDAAFGIANVSSSRVRKARMTACALDAVRLARDALEFCRARARRASRRGRTACTRRSRSRVRGRTGSRALRSCARRDGRAPGCRRSSRARSTALRFAQIVDVEVAHAERPDLAVGDQLLERAHRLAQRELPRQCSR